MREGLYEVLPEHLLTLLTWEELEDRVCGRKDFDVELLKRNTTYVGMPRPAATGMEVAMRSPTTSITGNYGLWGGGQGLPATSRS